LSSHPPAIPASDWFFEGSLFSYGTGSTGPNVSTEVVASAGWKTRIVTLDQSTWQTCRRRDADPVTTLSLGGRAAVMNDPARVPIVGDRGF